MFKIAIPILGVASSVAAERFYCDKLGFRRKFAYRPDTANPDPCYMGLVRDGAHLVISSFDPDGPPGVRTVQIFIDNADALYQEYERAGLTLGPLWDQEWGNREFGLEDPDGNHINFAQAVS